MTPYRTIWVAEAAQYVPRTLSGRLRSWKRRLSIKWNGTYLERYPIRCPCGKRSWDPQEVRGLHGSKNASEFRLKANQYRCGERHGLMGHVVLC